jgi:hypothetical protein
METADEMAEGQIRRFLTTFFVARKRRLLKTLAELYSWSPEELAAHDERFIKINDSVPLWSN